MARPNLINIAARDLFYAQMLIEDIYFYKRLGHANRSDVVKLVKERQYNSQESKSVFKILKDFGLYQPRK